MSSDTRGTSSAAHVQWRDGDARGPAIVPCDWNWGSACDVVDPSRPTTTGVMRVSSGDDSGGCLVVADFLGGIGGVGDEGESVDFLGRKIPLAFKSEPALPAGAGPAPGVAAAPSTIGGAGTAPGAGVASAGGSAGGAAGPTTLAQIARALGLSQEALKATDWAKRLFAPETPTSAPQPSNQIAPDVPLAEGQPTMFD